MRRSILRPRLRRIAAAVAATLAVPVGLTACQFDGGESSTLHVVAGSEIKDMAPILEQMQRETGVTLSIDYMGTLEGTEALLERGENLQPVGSNEHAWDAAWFPSNRYLSLFPESSSIVTNSESIMRSPVVLGVKPETAQRLGWSDSKHPSWQQVVKAVEEKKLRFGMTSPISSNSGFTTLVQATTALSGTGTVLEEGDIAKVTPQLKTFASGQSLASGSSGWLADRFIEDQTLADGIFNYESVLIGMRDQGVDLQIVTPSDGIITSDYPLSLLAGVPDEKREAYTKAVEYLLRPEVQQQIAETTHRRTSATQAPSGPTEFELPFPARLETVQSLLETWVGTARKPANMVFQIDTSGSMGRDDRMEALRTSLLALSGQGAETGSSRLLSLQPRERIAFVEFADNEKSRLDVTIPEDRAGYDQALNQVTDKVNSYRPRGGTAIYTSLSESLKLAAQKSGDDTLSSIVLFTDGESNKGMSADDFTRWYQQNAKDMGFEGIPVHAIVFGEGDPEELQDIAELTGGRVFDAQNESLTVIFREIRGYL